MRPLARRILARAVVVSATLALLLLTLVSVGGPSNDRQWHPAQRVLPRVQVRGDLVEIRKIRDFSYRAENDFDARYVDRTFDLRRLDSVWYGLSRFGGIPGIGHAFLSFGFGDEYVTISVEARKEAHESYSPLRGLFRQYELMYVIGTEHDVIGLRTDVWREDVSLYPVRATPAAMRKAFTGMVQRAEKLAREPEFYNTITSSCSSNIVRHVNAVAPGHVRAGIRTALPAFSDRVAHERGLIDSDLPLQQLRETFRVPPGLLANAGPEDFSKAIRARFPRRASADSP